MLILFKAYFRTESRSIVVLGGAFDRHLQTVVFGPNPMILPPLPNPPGDGVPNIFVAMNNHGQLIAGGGISTECWILQNRKWVHHSFLNAEIKRNYPTAVSMSNGIYLFGLLSNRCGTVKRVKPNEEPICEFLPNGSNVWDEGPQIPFR